MQKKLFSVVLLVVMLLATASPALAAGKSISLAEIRFIIGKGYVFLFDMTGDFKESELTGEVFINSNSYPLSCVIKENGQIACTSKFSGDISGKSVSGTLAGFAFEGAMPEKICPWYALSIQQDFDGEIVKWPDAIYVKSQMKQLWVDFLLEWGWTTYKATCIERDEVPWLD